jgi:hypothetical protein
MLLGVAHKITALEANQTNWQKLNSDETEKQSANSVETEENNTHT